MTPDNAAYKKILFRLQRDQDGYPPDDWETLWAYEVEPGLYSIDSIPFFVRDLSWGDVVSVDQKGDELFFKEVVRPSGHSVLRVIVDEPSKTDEVHESLRQIGCDTEQSHLPSLLSVDVPPAADLNLIRAFLDKGESEGRWEYETAAIRHA